MNPAFQEVIKSTDSERGDLFAATSSRLGTSLQFVEKDFWVCWMLDALFNGLPSGSPRLLFKGGTSLSKAYDLISRFSEDIDIVVFRDDLGQGASIEDLERVGKNKRERRLDAIKGACREYINGTLTTQLGGLINTAMSEAKVSASKFRLEPDATDADGQSLLFWYPSSTESGETYVQAAVRIESGAKSALDPHEARSVRPYVDVDLAVPNLSVGNITTVLPSRTFWDKVIILHGNRQWFERKGELRRQGQRTSRHYYDVYRLTYAEDSDAWITDAALGEDCARHARMFFNSAPLGLTEAKPGSFTLTPPSLMKQLLSDDYRAMSGMLFGERPSFGTVLDAVTKLEARLNA